jgi:hypothetical protein
MRSSTLPKNVPTAVDEPASPRELATVQPNAIAVVSKPTPEARASSARASKYRWLATKPEPAPLRAREEANAEPTPSGDAAPTPALNRKVVHVQHVSRHYEYHVEYVYGDGRQAPAGEEPSEPRSG